MRSDEVWRHECEVRWLAPLPDGRVTEFLEKVEKHRGRPAAVKLASDMRAARRAARASTETAASR
ncbi:DUF7696 family protein [Cupriavidus malaysiensis]|uniref:DUF7696 family protein n=1 Tax=Cupriavidus malaysiensis TaxID=367825 RepID=UPI003AAFD8CD